MRPLTLFVITLASVAAAAARAAEAPATTIDSVSAESVSTDTETTTTFHDEVVATGNDLTLTCDFLKVIATRVGEKSATLGKYGKFKYLLATGHVRIVQGDRVATCGRAEVFPGDDRIVLTENPVVKIETEHYEASGPRMVLYRGQRRAVIEGTPTQRTHITLPAIKDLGFPSETPAK
ncbi:MAG: LptA/OstA family protein [Opitutaceae bacterium]|jgi:lipopolysaccharide export system protein LptA